MGFYLLTPLFIGQIPLRTGFLLPLLLLRRTARPPSRLWPRAATFSSATKWRVSSLERFPILSLFLEVLPTCPIVNHSHVTSSNQNSFFEVIPHLFFISLPLFLALPFLSPLAPKVRAAPMAVGRRLTSNCLYLSCFVRQWPAAALSMEMHRFPLSCIRSFLSFV